MKPFLLLLLFGFFDTKICNGQLNSECQTLQQDTIQLNFIAELNTRYITYNIAGTSVQDNLIFIRRPGKTANCETIYNTDTVILKFPFENQELQKCINQNAINKLYQITDLGLMDEADQKTLKKSIYKSNWGVKYLEFSATLVVVNTGGHSIKIPITEKFDKNDKTLRFREKYFKNVLVVISASDIKY